MTLTPGTELGPYQITGLIGKGGMGEVYKAHDPRLGRDVAIKVAGEAFSERFTREARAIAALNHTNVCHLYDVGPNYLVMEFVDGDELRGPMAFDDALPILRQLIDGIEAAHEKNIIHRDLKPANVKVTSEGVVKILDFGLARAMDSVEPADLSNSPTMAPTFGATAQGMILGTSAYMAPEQAKGKQADKRADIWGFGVIAYELLTGKKVFPGESTVEILGAVLNKEPDLSVAPPRVRRLLGWCLEKDRKNRLQAIGDARRLLAEDLVAAAAPTERPAAAGSRVAWTLAALAVVLLAAVSWIAFRPTPDLPERRLDIVTPATSEPMSFALSPDGGQIVFVASGDGARRLWLRPLDKTAAQPLAGTEGARFPFWSPDGRKVGFFADGKLKRLDLAGGAPQPLADAAPRGGAWNADGTILFTPTVSSPLFRIRESGGEATAVTKLDRQTAHRFPIFLPDAREFLFYALGTEDAAGIYVGSLDGGEPARLTAADAAGVYLPGDWLLFPRGGTLLAQRVERGWRELIGDAVTVADTVGFDATTGAHGVSVSANGAIAYRAAGSLRRQLTWFDRSSKVTGVFGSPDDTGLSTPRLSPDGRRVALSRTVQRNQDIWVMDSDRASRLTRDARLDRFPVWSPNGDRIAFDSNRTGRRNLFWKPSSGADSDEPLLETEHDKVAMDWSPDGRFIGFIDQTPAGFFDIWMLPLDGDRKPFPFVQTSADERRPMFSRDGRWVAYYSNESERYEVYVKPFPGPGAAKLISTAGGFFPQWAPGDKEIYYFAPDGMLMATPISKTGQTIEPGRPVSLFRPPIHGGGTDINVGGQYDVSPDGRFLVNVELEDAAATLITLIQNWKAP